MDQMKDRYLFKAKTCTGEWVSGFLHCKENKWYISNKAGIPFAFEVRPDTICQCTGVTDENGNLIWENDIVKFDVYCYEKLESSIISQIKWCNDLCALSLVVTKRGTRGTLGHLMDINKECSVIGNIFDNPELLEIKRKENTACFTQNEVDLVCSAIIDSPVDTPRELQDKVLTVLKNNMTILE